MVLSLVAAMPAYAPMTAPTGAAVKVAMSAEKFKVFVDSPVADTTLEKPWTSGEVC